MGKDQAMAKRTIEIDDCLETMKMHQTATRTTQEIATEIRIEHPD